MPNIASLLKDEITRLARKEVKAQTGVLRKANAQYRRDIARLKRESSDLAKRVDYLVRQEKKRAESGAASSESTEGRRFSRRGLCTHRERTGLSAADYARLIGVTAQTIYNWEQGRSKPRAEQLSALISIRNLGKREATRRLELLGD